jgi:hypothetical protein
MDGKKDLIAKMKGIRAHLLILQYNTGGVRLIQGRSAAFGEFGIGGDGPVPFSLPESRLWAFSYIKSTILNSNY